MCQLAVLVSQCDLSVCHIDGITRWVECQNLLAGIVCNPFVVNGVVVTIKDDVKAWHLLGYSGRGIFLKAVKDKTSILAAVKKPNDYVGLFNLTDIRYPLLGTCNHVLKIQTGI